ncbi:MAG: aminotransferase class IV [Bacilli bacterium]
MLHAYNGVCMAAEAMHISPFDHGFLYGVGAFETFRTHDGHVLHWAWHMERLFETLDALHIRAPFTKDTLLQYVKDVVTANGGCDLVVRLNVSAGVAPMGIYTGVYEQPNVFLFVRPVVDKVLPRQLATVSTARNTPEGKSRQKTHHYLNSIFAKREVRDGDDALMCTQDGVVAETSIANVFFVKEGVVFTPSVQTGILPGVMRRWVIAWCAQQGIEVYEGEFQLDELLQSDEVFITNSVQGVVPVCGVDQTDFPVDGPLIQRIQRAHEQQIEEMRRSETV